MATYGGGTDAAQFSFRRQSDTGGNEDWTPWYEMFCGIRKYENLTLPTDGSGIQIATAKEVETFKWILLDLNKYQDGIGDSLLEGGLPSLIGGLIIWLCFLLA